MCELEWAASDDQSGPVQSIKISLNGGLAAARKQGPLLQRASTVIQSPVNQPVTLNTTMVSKQQYSDVTEVPF